jgi:DHA1 family bicyclomycin/chloramphenicol resistance-like MFS transporter
VDGEVKQEAERGGDAAARPRRARGLALLLAALTGMTALAIDMSLPAMPQLRSVFGADVAAVQLTLSLFLAGYAAGQLVCGPLSDRVGRRPVLLAGLALFTAAGLACAAAGSLPVLVACRLVQGMGASVGPILARAVIRDRFGAREGAAVLSQVTVVMVAAPLVAPTLGGYVLVHLGWHAIFLVLGAAGAALWLASWRGLPESLPAGHAAEGGPGAVLASYRDVLRHRAGRAHLWATCFAYAGMFAYVSASPFVFIDGFGVPRQRFGLLFALTAGSMMAGAALNRALLARHSPDALLRRGAGLVLAAGAALLLAAWTGTGGAAGVLLPMMAYMLGMGLVQPNATAGAMAPHGRLAGVASSLMGSLQTAGSSLTGFAAGSLYDGTPRSLATVVAVMAALVFFASRRVGAAHGSGAADAASLPAGARA